MGWAKNKPKAWSSLNKTKFHPPSPIKPPKCMQALPVTWELIGVFKLYIAFFNDGDYLTSRV